MLEADNGENVVNQILHDAIADNDARKPHCTWQTYSHSTQVTSDTKEKDHVNIKKNEIHISTDDKTNGSKDSSVNDKRRIHPLVAYVHAGETLYLPAMWLHRVAQHADTQDLHRRAHFRCHIDSSRNNTCQADDTNVR